MDRNLATDSSLSSATTVSAQARRPWRLAFLALVVVGAAVLAGFLLLHFLEHSRSLFSDPMHDRHAHLQHGLSLATNVRHARPVRALLVLDRCRTWPPLHDGLLVGTSLLAGGGDPRWAVLPSLFAWFGTAVFAFLLAGRLVKRGGTVAGLFAATLVLVSPALRAYATDIMIESLGAFLTLTSLYYYVRVRQEGNAGPGRLFALSLSVLFFTKYNYWGLVVLGIVAEWLFADLAGNWTRSKRIVAGLPWQAIRRELVHPFNWLIVALLLCSQWSKFTGRDSLELFGQSISMRGGNLVTAAYALALVRPAIWFWRGGRERLRQAGPVVWGLTCLHTIPLLLWFCWPHKITSFVWFVNPATNVGEVPNYDRVGGYFSCWDWLSQDYLLGFWSALVVVGLAALAVFACLARRTRPGASVIAWLVLLSVLACANHPNRKSRYIHSWVPVVFVGAGVGAGFLVGFRRRLLGVPVKPAFAAIVGTAVVLHLPALADTPRAPEGGPRPGSPSVLELTDAYLPFLEESKRPAVFSNLPMKQFAWWTYQVRHPRADRLQTDIKGYAGNAKDHSDCFRRWLETTDRDTVVYLDFAPTSRCYAPNLGFDGMSQFAELLGKEEGFAVVHRRNMSEHGCTITVWKRIARSRQARAGDPDE